MALFQPGYLKEGPGIEKDAPPKTGIALFFEILVREFWQLLKLNLLFVFCSLPVFTFGAARAALSRCTINMVRDVPNDVWDDFRQAFRQDFRRNGLLGLAELLAGGVTAAALLLTEQTAVRTVLLVGLAAQALFWSYLWSMLAALDVPFSGAVRNALLLPLLCPQYAFPALVLAAGIVLIHVPLFPLSLPSLLFVPFGMGSFVMSFCAWSGIKRYLLKKSEKKI